MLINVMFNFFFHTQVAAFEEFYFILSNACDANIDIAYKVEINHFKNQSDIFILKNQSTILS